MIALQQLIDFFDLFAPPTLAESWDNVGLLTGDPTSRIDSVLTCLTLNKTVAEEAIEKNVQAIVSHHPILFRPVQRLTTETHEGRMLLSLIQAGVAVYSPHTRYDSATDGINTQLARSFGLQDIRPLRPSNDQENATGSGRWGRLPAPISLRDLIQQTKQSLRVDGLQFVGDLDRQVDRLGIACGAAAEFLQDAAKLGCQALLTGEARFHACLEAEASGIALILPGHYATERPAMEELARILSDQFPNIRVQASESEFDPIRFA